MTDKPPIALVVEDDRDNREGCVEFLRFSGFDVVSAADGEEALGTALSAPPDVVVIDLRLPRMSGYEVTRRLKTDRRTRDVPILAVSACVMPEDRRRAHEAGCDGFVCKPCDPSALVGAIRALLPTLEGGAPRTRR
jgi:CheY-like chemotaxis protein